MLLASLITAVHCHVWDNFDTRARHTILSFRGICVDFTMTGMSYRRIVCVWPLCFLALQTATMSGFSTGPLTSCSVTSITMQGQYKSSNCRLESSLAVRTLSNDNKGVHVSISKYTVNEICNFCLPRWNQTYPWRIWGRVAIHHLYCYIFTLDGPVYFLDIKCASHLTTQLHTVV